MIGKIDNFALALSVDSRVRLIDKVIETFRKPVVTSRLAGVPVHTLLDNGPMTVSRYEEAVQVQVKPILNSRAIDLGNQTAGLRESQPVEADTFAQRLQLVWGLSRVLASAAANIDAKLAAKRREPSL